MAIFKLISIQIISVEYIMTDMEFQNIKIDEQGSVNKLPLEHFTII